MFSFSALSLPQTQHMETFSERPWLREKKSKAPDILFLLSPPQPHLLSNWLSYTHLLATCRNIPLMNILRCVPGLWRAITRYVNGLFWWWWGRPCAKVWDSSLIPRGRSVYARACIAEHPIYSLDFGPRNKYTSTHMRQSLVGSIVCHKYAGRVG